MKIGMRPVIDPPRDLLIYPSCANDKFALRAPLRSLGVDRVSPLSYSLSSGSLLKLPWRASFRLFFKDTGLSLLSFLVYLSPFELWNCGRFSARSEKSSLVSPHSVLNFNVLTIMIGFIAIISLAWAVLLSVYLVKEWDNFTLLQRKSLALTYEAGYRFDR